MQRHRCSTMQSRHSSREKSAHRKVGIKTKTGRRGKNNQSRPLLNPGTNHSRSSIFAPPKPRTPSQRRTRKIQKVRKCAGSRVPANSLACHQSFNTWSKVPMWIQAHLKAPCAAAQRLRAHAADATTGLAYARLALRTASAGRGSLANAEGANTATATGTATRRLRCACRGSHALFHGQLKLVD